MNAKNDSALIMQGFNAGVDKVEDAFAAYLDETAEHYPEVTADFIAETVGHARDYVLEYLGAVTTKEICSLAATPTDTDESATISRTTTGRVMPAGMSARLTQNWVEKLSTEK